MTKNEDNWIKVATISGKPAEAIQFLLNTTGILDYRDNSKGELKVLDLYTDSDQFKYIKQEEFD